MYGQGSHARMPPFQQRPLAPPPPPLQPTLPSMQPSSTQQGPHPVPHNVGYSGSLYQHAPSRPGPPIQVPNRGLLNTGPYLPPPPPLPQQVRGSTSVPHPYPTSQPTSQWTQNTYHIPRPHPPPIDPSPSYSSTLSSQGQTLYRGPIHRMPPPPTSSFFTTAPSGSFVHSVHQNSDVPVGPMMPPPPPPPPPSSPPPLPSSPPPPTSPLPSFGTLSSAPLVIAGNLSHNSGSDPISSLAVSEKMASTSVDTVVVTTEIGVDGFENDCDKNPEGSTSYQVGSIEEEDLYDMDGRKLDLPSPPPKPAEKKVVQKIVGLCGDIARNGPSFEGDARKKELGNPEFNFLFGGEPGSEAAIAHEYFGWMKNKCILARKLQYEERNLALRPSDKGTSIQTSTLVEAGLSPSPSDSDMDMEDDITQPNEEQQGYDSFEGLNNEGVIIPKGFPGKLHTSPSAIEQSLAKDAIPGSSGLTDPGKVDESGLPTDCKHFPDHDFFSNPKVDCLVMDSAGAAPCPSNSNLAKLSIPPLEDSNQCNASAVTSEKIPGELIKSVSPFRLIQDYASDDSSADDAKPCLEDASPVPASPSTTASGSNLLGDQRSNVQATIRSKGLSSDYMTFGMSSESVVPCSLGMSSKALDLSPESRRSYADANITSIAAVKTEVPLENDNENKESTEDDGYPEAPESNNSFDGVRDVAPKSVESLRLKEDVKYTSALPKVDKFGRLVRQGASDSDSDEQYTGRRIRRGKSGRRSRSPHDRRRRSPPVRRMQKRSWSRSWSPKKERSRSKSPTYRRRDESSGDKMRRYKGQLPQCYDFVRGRCYRGTLCRYMHHESEKTDGGRRHRSKQQDAEVPPVSGTSGSLEGLDKSADIERVLVPKEDESVDIVHETQDIEEEKRKPTTEILEEENCAEIVETVHPLDGFPTSHGVASSPGNLVIPRSQANPSLPVLQNAFDQPSDVGDFSMSGSLFIQASSTFQNHPPVSAPHLDEMSPIHSYPGTSSSQAVAYDSFSSQTVPPKDLLPPIIPSLPSLSQGTVTPPMPQLPGEIMQPPLSFPPFCLPMENCPPNEVPLQNQHSYFPVPPSSSWSLPPPPPLPSRLPFVDNATLTSVIATQGYHGLQLQQNQLPPRPSLNMGDFKQQPLPMVNPRSQPFSGPSFAQGNMSFQHVSSTMESVSFPNYPHLPQQRALYGQQQPADSRSVNLGDYGNKSSTLTRSPDLVDRNQVSNLADFGGSRIPNHYNPFASTFDLPLTSKFSSNVLKREKDRPYLFDGSHGLSQVRPDGLGDQYDPLFDSIEPSSNSYKKFDCDQRGETTLSCSGSRKLIDVEENNKRNNVEAVAITTSIKSENDECGDTAGEEVGDVDDLSASNPLDEGNAAVGEIEIDQIKTPGKRKKSKDSRSTKYFKVAIANFVKAELKTSWRQGRLSKEAFKIIVKKVVDKVSGAMKSHHVPKSEAKINHYIDSSQGKLSKLVTGYLDKYAKG